ncbi:MAG: methanol dehydrogenase, partial [Pseudomonas sp.]|nr:methanol dehydrogenase [Pseudomonas sp.]
VDRAELLDTQAEARLTSMLAGHEQATGEQVVVVTVPDLGGRSIEEFGLELGRTWGIGQEGEDNGALLIVARDDRKIRIEVGYGLEGRLTDAQSSVIINRIIAPAFQRGDFTAGITEGAEAIITVLGGDPLPAELRPVMPMAQEQPGGLGILGFFLMLVAIFVIGGGRGGRGGGRRALLLGALLGGMGRGGGFGGGGFGGGGFGGGGGGFGGGGASGGW